MQRGRARQGRARHLGTAILDFIWDTYENHPRVLRLAEGANRGITELVLREY